MRQGISALVARACPAGTRRGRLSHHRKRPYDPSVTTTLRPVGEGDFAVLERLWQLYRHDLSEFRDSYPNEDGLFKAHRLGEGTAYFIDSEPGLAGFVQVGGENPLTVDAFFIVRSYRRRRVGRAAALEVLRRHPGQWELAFQDENPQAARFWRAVVAEVDPNYREERRPVPGKPHIAPDVWLMFTA